MDRTRREREIMDLVRDERLTRVMDLAERLGVSDETVRRNLKPLVAEGLLARMHGGVRLLGDATDAPFLQRMKVNADAKRRLAKAAAERVRDGQTLMIDTGSTTAFVAQALGRARDLTVVTNSLEIARHLVGRNGNRIFMAGGELRADLAAAIGAEAEGFIRRFRADLAILSIASIDPRGGFADFDLEEARIARAMIDCADTIMVVADGSKFASRAPVAACEPQDVDALFSDAPPPGETASWLEEAGVEVVTAAVGREPEVVD